MESIPKENKEGERSLPTRGGNNEDMTVLVSMVKRPNSFKFLAQKRNGRSREKERGSLMVRRANYGDPTAIKVRDEGGRRRRKLKDGINKGVGGFKKKMTREQ